MKSLFFHIGTPSPILETEIELIKLALEKKENVTLVKCISDIETCFFNRSHRKSFCKKCISKLDNGLKITGVKNDINLLDLELSKLNLKYKVPKFKSIDQIKNFKFEKAPIGFGISSSLLSHELEHRPNLNKFKYDLDFVEDIKKKTLSSIKIYLYFKKLIKKSKPDKVYLFNGRISDTWPIICLCKKYKINYYTYEIAAKNMYRVIQNSTPHLIQTQIKPKKKFLKENITKKILLAKRYIYDKKNLFREYSMTNFSTFQKKKFDSFDE